MGRDGQGTEQPKLDVHVDETMAEADTHLVRLARAEAKQVVTSRCRGMAGTTAMRESQEAAASTA
jgi:hypothetical protein